MEHVRFPYRHLAQHQRERNAGMDGSSASTHTEPHHRLVRLAWVDAHAARVLCKTHRWTIRCASPLQ